MSAKDALKYAEDELGVHECYEKAVRARNDLDQCLTLISEKRDIKRDLEVRIADKEMEVAEDERSKHPDMSVTGMEKHLKIAYSNDGDIRTMKDELNKAISEIEGLEYDKIIHEADIRINTARMKELGGYFHYLAIVKDVANRR